MLLKWAVRLRARAFYFRILFPLAAWMRSGRVLNGERYSCCAARHLRSSSAHQRRLSSRRSFRIFLSASCCEEDAAAAVAGPLPGQSAVKRCCRRRRGAIKCRADELASDRVCKPAAERRVNCLSLYVPYDAVSIKAKFHYAIQLANQLASWSATC